MKKITILLILVFLCGCSKQPVEATPQELSVNFNDKDIEVYSEVYLHDLVSNTNAKITSDNKLIDTSKIGKHEYEIKLDLDSKTYTEALQVNVVDTTPPLIISGLNKTIEVGYEKDISQLIMFGDNYDRNPSCVIEGAYNVNEVGVYNLNYIVTDSNNNTTSQEVILNVVNKEDISHDTTPILFNDIIDAHKTEDTAIGIDVSKWQSEIDFNQVKEAGASFVFMRIGVQTTPNGEISMDSYYLDNIKKAKEVGLPVGVYLYSIATSMEESIAHANWVIDSLDDEKLDFPIVFDWENWSDFSKYNLNLFDINEIASAFITTVENAGYEGMLYSSKTHLEYIWNTDIFDSVWLAHYIDQTTYEGKYDFWQLTDSGIIDGIDGYVDINIMYKK
ncbi:MAG: GH25 family lysozyme [Coprobacillaceae bacterium]